MTRSSFWTLFFFLHLTFIFVKIYQHNLYVHEIYKKQNLVDRKGIVQLSINKLEQKLMRLKSKLALMQEAQELGMKPLAMSQVQELTLNEVPSND